MQVSDFDYNLPADLIAQTALTERADSRMLYLNRAKSEVRDCRFREFPTLLQRSDLVVFNDTRVFPARLFGRKLPLGATSHPQGPASGMPQRGRVEVLLTRQLSEDAKEWECLVKPGKRVAVGDGLVFGGPGADELRAEVIGRGSFGERRIRFSSHDDLFGLIDRIGHVPLPPYINRVDSAGDAERYQTIYAREWGSVAAPTAGLHFSPEIFLEMKSRGIETAQVTLHVGLGTFQPVRVDQVEQHKIHSEPYSISLQAAEAINAARYAGRRVIAIGTTTARTLEYSASREVSGKVSAGKGEADIFICPGYKFRTVDAILTNFHLPRSTLLMLVCAFAGREQTLAAYKHAVAERYRFYSYGDCMFIE